MESCINKLQERLATATSAHEAEAWSEALKNVYIALNLKLDWELKVKG